MLQSTMMIISGLICLGCTGAVASFASPIGGRLGLVDTPDERKRHRKSTPLLGGVTLACVVLPICLVVALWASDPVYRRSIFIFIAATFSMTLIGLADDRHSLSARNRIVLAVLVFGLAAIADPIFNLRVLSFATPRMELGLVTWPLAVAFTVLCCVGLVNSVNMADGKNGLVIGLCLGWLAILWVRGPEPLRLLLYPIGGALLILLVFNLRGRLFLGDGGSYGFGTAVGLLTIATYNTPGLAAGRALSAEQVMLMFAVPVLDSFRLTYVRIRRGQSPMTADRDHLHHHLQDRFGWPLGLFIYWVLALLPTALIVAI